MKTEEEKLYVLEDWFNLERWLNWLWYSPTVMLKKTPWSLVRKAQCRPSRAWFLLLKSKIILGGKVFLALRLVTFEEVKICLHEAHILNMESVGSANGCESGGHQVWDDNHLKVTSLVAQMVKRLPAMQETWVQSLGGEDPRKRKWQPTPVFLPEEFHGQRSLAGYSPQGHKQSGTTERLSLKSTGLGDLP